MGEIDGISGVGVKSVESRREHRLRGDAAGTLLTPDAKAWGANRRYPGSPPKTMR